MTSFLLAALVLAGALGPQPPAVTVAPAPVAAGTALSLAEAVALALRQSPAARRARLTRDAALVQAGLLQPELRPDVTFAAQGGLRTPVVRDPAAPQAVVRRDLAGRLELSAEQILFAPGSDWLVRRNAASRAAAQADCEAALAKVVQEVKLAWLDLSAAQAGAVLADAGVAQAEAQARRVDDLLAVQRVAEVDRLQAKVGVLEAQAGQAEAANGARLAAANLRRLLGESELAAPLAAAALGAVPGPLPALPEAIAWAREHRPEVIALRARATEATAGAELARGRNAPTLSAVGSLSGQTPTAFERGFDATLGLVVKVPLSRMDNAAAREAADARAGAQQALLGLEELRGGLELEVRRAWLDDQTARRKLELAGLRVDAASEAYRVKGLQYDRQRTTLVELQQARLEQSRAELDRLLAQVAVLRAGVAFETATGRRP